MTRVVFRNQQEFKAWNDSMVEKYDIERFHDHPSPFVRYVEGKRIRRTFALLAPGPRDRVLEVGCGAGHLLERLPEGRRFGLDLSESMLRRAQRRVDPGTLLQANAESLPFRTGAWDRVYCSEVLEHLADPRAALAEIERLKAELDLKRGPDPLLSAPTAADDSKPERKTARERRIERLERASE